MSTIAIIAIIVGVLIIIGLLAFVIPRMRARARMRARERELEGRRERVAGEHHAEAEQRQREAAEAEQRARIAEREAQAQRAQAELHEERAGLHERGMADHELIDDHERERFAGTSATRPGTAEGDGLGHDEGGTLDADRRGGVGANDYQRGRTDEAMERDARFTRPDDAAIEERERTNR